MVEHATSLSSMAHRAPQVQSGGRWKIERERERDFHIITRLRSTGTLNYPLLSTVIVISPSKHDSSRENKYLEDKKALGIMCMM